MHQESRAVSLSNVDNKEAGDIYSTDIIHESQVNFDADGKTLLHEKINRN